MKRYFLTNDESNKRVFANEELKLGKVKRYSFLFPKVPLKDSDPEDVLILRGIFLI
ncbi:MAG: hypothetical protein KDK54_20075 [Leptospiraceae bacterium]|nr:hypothetical protein [Leptospiraceae bacterium]